jgi:hypothetical protein
MPFPDDHNWSAGMLLRWVLTRDKASVLAMAKDYGSLWVDVEGKGVERVRPQGWDDVAWVIAESLPAEERLTAAVVRAGMSVIPAMKEIREFLRSGDLQCQARRNGSGDIENVGREQWGGLRPCSFEGRDFAVPVNSVADSLLPRSLPDYLSGGVPANETPTVWVDLVFSAEQAMRRWRPNENSVVDPGSLFGELGVRSEESPVPPPEVCLEQPNRAAYVRRVEEFRNAHQGRNPPVQTTQSGLLQGDREWATANGISRFDITQWRREVLGEQKGGRPKNSAGNSAKK